MAAFYKPIDQTKSVDDNVENLTELQKSFLDCYFANDKNIRATAESMGRTVDQTYNIYGNPNVQKAVIYRDKGVHNLPSTQLSSPSDNNPQNYRVPVNSRVDLLWEIAQKGAGMVYDKEGNEIMMNPAASVAAIRSITDIEGGWAPKETEVNVNIKDDRSVEEISANVKALMAEYQQLALNAGVTDADVHDIIDMPSIEDNSDAGQEG